MEQLDCCAAPKAEAARVPCPGCGANGKPVGEETVQGLLIPEALAALGVQGRSFCRTASCPVLYFAADGSVAHKAQARVRVGMKETEGPRPLCYCFGHTYEDVAAEVAGGGACSIPTLITAEVRAGRCACERMNPAGNCCLGEVNRAVKEARVAVGLPLDGPSPRAPVVPDERRP
ncbi:putative iron-sulfur cluster-binding metallochaperone [Myxococcus xanthus]|jgi:hypothetical protein|uniref:Copper chaperone Copz family protein n=1 Tax=Myxococcus xanthus TaxID=34 RepID=A0A7Y4IQE3_MYXXA|nr:copper chaperone Copz family protein [Myxococcus xanthus]NOJ83438.1 copper chaperone Copz family protein [Myxococcus xanthus]NOJ90765.1 copper chaperone Copz family protein [Myxococcus xanthus]